MLEMPARTCFWRDFIFCNVRKNTITFFLKTMLLSAIKTASLLWFFIGYWILKRGWISIRPPFFLGKSPPAHQYNHALTRCFYRRISWPLIPIFAV